MNACSRLGNHGRSSGGGAEPIGNEGAVSAAESGSGRRGSADSAAIRQRKLRRESPGAVASESATMLREVVSFRALSDMNKSCSMKRPGAKCFRNTAMLRRTRKQTNRTGAGEIRIDRRNQVCVANLAWSRATVSSRYLSRAGARIPAFVATLLPFWLFSSIPFAVSRTDSLAFAFLGGAFHINALNAKNDLHIPRGGLFEPHCFHFCNDGLLDCRALRNWRPLASNDFERIDQRNEHHDSGQQNPITFERARFKASGCCAHNSAVRPHGRAVGCACQRRT